MKNSKKLFLIVLSVLIVAFVSCNKVTEPTTFKVSAIAGNWSGDGVAFTISESGNFSMTSPFTLTYQIPEADWNSEKTEYTINGAYVSPDFSDASITFTSASTGTATSEAGPTPIRRE